MEIMHCENLSKIYQTGEASVFALDDVSLSLASGSFTAITGPSGSGKSTLLHLLGGLDKPTKGTVYYRENDLYKYNEYGDFATTTMPNGHEALRYRAVVYKRVDKVKLPNGMTPDDYTDAMLRRQIADNPPEDENEEEEG